MLKEEWFSSLCFAVVTLKGITETAKWFSMKRSLKK